MASSNDHSDAAHLIDATGKDSIIVLLNLGSLLLAALR